MAEQNNFPYGTKESGGAGAHVDVSQGTEMPPGILPDNCRSLTGKQPSREFTAALVGDKAVKYSQGESPK